MGLHHSSCRGILELCNDAFHVVYAADELHKAMKERSMLGNRDDSSAENDSSSKADVTDLLGLIVSDLFLDLQQWLTAFRTKYFCISEKDFSTLNVEIEDPKEQKVLHSCEERDIENCMLEKFRVEVGGQVECFNTSE